MVETVTSYMVLTSCLASKLVARLVSVPSVISVYDSPCLSSLPPSLPLSLSASLWSRSHWLVHYPVFCSLVVPSPPTTHLSISSLWACCCQFLLEEKGFFAKMARISPDSVGENHFCLHEVRFACDQHVSKMLSVTQSLINNDEVKN